MLNYTYKETILPTDPALKPFNSPKDRSSVFICKHKPKELATIFVLNY
jgi:hypothetical protein